ncbi:hypothetical protein RNZ50_14590 [Paracoccaceae bacterium Fryx2]|nr:hypothetical protein [Paracoccaceae bacterium Fryx2]
MTTRSFRLLPMLCAAALMAAAPVHLSKAPDGMITLAPSTAEARHGADDRGRDDRRGRGRDDAGIDGRGPRHGSGGAHHQPGMGGKRVAKVEVSARGIEVEYRNGSKEEIENGIYERKNAANRTVEERPATQADIDRLMALR